METPPTTQLSDGLVALLLAVTGAEPLLVVAAESAELVRADGTAAPSYSPAQVRYATVPVEDLVADAERTRAHLTQSLQGIASVALLPPLGRVDQILRSAGPTLGRAEASVAAASNVAAALAPGVRIAYATVRSALAGLSKGASIEQLLQGRHLAGVIELSGADIYDRVSADFRLCLVNLLPDKPKAVRFVVGPRQPGSDLAAEYQALAEPTARTAHGFALPSAPTPNPGLLPLQVDPLRERRIEEVALLGEPQRLSDLFDVLPGNRKPIRGAIAPPGHLPTVRPSDRRSREADGAESVEWADPRHGGALRAGDVLLSRYVLRGASLQVRLITTDDVPAAAGPHAVILRPRVKLDPAHVRFLVRFIGSTRFVEQIPSLVGGYLSFNRTELSEAVLPTPDPDYLRALEAIDEASAAFGTWLGEARELVDLSIMDDDVASARLDLIARSTLLRQRAQAAMSLDDLDYRVATRFPLPVAYRWRACLAERGTDRELRGLLHAQEILHAYLGIMTLLCARIGGIELGSLRDIRQRLSKGNAGIGLGDWRALLREASQLRTFRRLESTTPFVEVRDLFADAAFASASDFLYAIRNDDAHLREPSPGTVRLQLDKAWDQMRSLFAAAEFITDYPLLRVRMTAWDTFEKHNDLTVSYLIGDHPVTPQERLRVTANEVESGSLYLRDRRGDVHLLRPLLTGSDCPECGHWSTFGFERLDRGGTVWIKSLEHGHQAQGGPGMVRQLRAVGLLEPEEQPQ